MKDGDQSNLFYLRSYFDRIQAREILYIIEDFLRVRAVPKNVHAI